MTVLITLRRLAPLVHNHALAFWGGMLGLLAARLFEAYIPYLLKEGIDYLATAKDSSTPADSFSAELGPIALAIAGCVTAQIIVTIISRILIRRVGVYAAF